jgi:hypothetical protein
MKAIFLYSGVFIICLSFIANPAKSQNSEPIARKSKPSSIKRQSVIHEVFDETRRANCFLTRKGLHYQNRSTNMEYIDTLNYPLPGTYTYYLADDGGYVTGNNAFGDVAKANYFEINQSVSLTGILFDFLIAVGGNPEIQIVMWDNTGTNHYPGNIIASETINLNEIKEDISNNQLTPIQFDVPVTLTTSFYAGFILPDNVGDTLAIWSNTDGDTNPGISWEKWSDNSWHPISSNDTWGWDISMAIFPIIISETQIEIDTLNYPLAGEYGIYVTPNGGYVTGNNETGDLAKANYFSNYQNRYITGLLLEFAYATGGNPNIEIAVWNNLGANGKPGSKIGSNSLFLNSIKNHIINNQFTYVTFDPPVNVSQPFYAGFMLPTTTGDTLVVWSNTDGDTSPPTAWELWFDNQWSGFTGTNTWNLDIALAIYPIVQNTLGTGENKIEKSLSVFPNPSHGLFNIVSEKIENESTDIQIYSFDGTLLRKINRKINEVLIIDLRNEPSGIYFLKNTQGSEIITTKLVKY